MMRSPKTILPWSALALGLVLLAGGAASAAEPDAKAQRTWKSKCGSCHGIDGKAATEMGKKLKIPDFTTKEWQKKATDEGMRKAITDGVKREGSEGMDGYKDKLDAAQIEMMIAIVRKLGK